MSPNRNTEYIPNIIYVALFDWSVLISFKLDEWYNSSALSHTGTTKRTYKDIFQIHRCTPSILWCDKVVVVVPLTHLMNNISTVHTYMNMSNALLLCLFGVGTYKYMYVWIHLMYKFYLILFCSHMTMYKCKTMLCVCVQEVNDIHSHLSRMISRRSSGSQPASQTLVE